MKSCARLAALFLGAFSYLLLHPLDTAAAFQISASGTRTNLHLTATTVPGARLVWLSGNRVDGITNVAQIETTPVAQHDFQLPATSSSQFFRAVMIDTNVERTPFAITSGHSLAILTNGSIVCWGDNSLGQFGNQAPKQYVGMGTIVACWYPSSGYINDSAGPLPQSTDTDWISVAAGTDYCLALKTNGSLWAWGNDASGGLGYAVPGGFYGGFYAFAVPVGTNATWQSVFAFGESSFAIRTDGTLWAWGDNTDSVLGVGSNYMSTNVVFLPTQVGTASNWVKVVSFPRNFSMGIQSDGSLWAWGSTTLPSYVRAGYAQTNLTLPVTVSPAPVNIPGPWVDVGFNLTSFVRGTLLRADGTLWAVTTNANDYGDWQVYETYFQNQYTNPGSVYNILIGAGATPADALTYVTGEFYQIYPFLLSFNFDYAAFLQKTSDAEFLQPYSSRSNWTMLASGIALNQDGTIWTLGEGVTRSATSPKDGDWQRVNADTDWRYVSAGFGAAKANGQVWGWESGSQPDIVPGTTSEMVKMPGTNKWISAKLTVSHVVAMDTQSNLWVWGANEFGQLGVGDNEPRLTPTPLPMPGPWLDYSVEQSGFGDDCMTIAIRTNGQLWAWGDYNFTSTNVPSPIQLNPERPWRSVFTHNDPDFSPTIFLIGQDTTLWAYGNNYGGGLGINSTNLTAITPQPVAGSNWLSVSPGYGFALALKTDGTRWAWGNSAVNMGLGFGTNLAYTNPVIVPGNTWLNVAADDSDGFAIRSDGTLWSWGQSDSRCQLGQPANQTLLYTNCWTCLNSGCGNPNPEVEPSGNNVIIVPGQIGTDNQWAKVKHTGFAPCTFGLKNDGSLWVWGQSPFASVSNQVQYLTAATHVFPAVPYPEYTGLLPIPYRVGTNTWSYMDPSGAAVTTSGDLYLWPARGGNGQTFATPAWLPSPIRSNVVCRLPPPIP